MSLNLHQVLHLYQTPSKFYIQPVDKQSEALIIDRQTCSISLNSMFSVGILPANATSSLIYGIIGIKHLVTCPYLIVITRATQIGTIEGSPIFRLDQAKSLPFEASFDLQGVNQRADEWNSIYVSMIYSVLETPSYYFSYSYDLTNCLQRKYQILIDVSLTTIPLDKYDMRFLWNQHLVSDFIKAGEITFRYLLPFILGFVSINKAAIRPGLNWILISRRSVRRAGTRFNSRGIDRDGNVANFVETEQILEDPTSGFVGSFVQVRGSIPLLWSQKSSYKYKPDIELDPNQDHDMPMRKHFDELKYFYGNISVVSLIDGHGHEARLANEFGKRMETFRKSLQTPYHHFDFHKECSKMRWHRLSILLDQLERELALYGFFAMENNKVMQIQTGVIRSNCIDSLDRTNVVQSMIAQTVLETQLKFIKRSSPSLRLMHQPGFMQVYKNAWADNADSLSIQYAGTPALKTDFTRTGHRTYMGMFKDGTNSLNRYAMNTFLDAYRQDAIELFLGYVEGYPSPRYRPLEVTSFTSPLSITLVVLTLIFLYAYLRSGSEFVQI